MTDVVMPQMGESIVEGTLTKWLKKHGDRIERDAPLFEISTDKVDTEIPSPAAGVVSEILVQEGQTVGINTVVARIEESSVVAPVVPPAVVLPPVAAPPVDTPPVVIAPPVGLPPARLPPVAAPPVALVPPVAALPPLAAPP